LYVFRVHRYQYDLSGIETKEINHSHASPLATALDSLTQFPAAVGVRDNIAFIRVFSQIKLKSREFVIIEILVTNRGKWMQFDECEHGLSVRF